MKKIKYLVFLVICLILLNLNFNKNETIKYKKIGKINELTYNKLYKEYNNSNIIAFLYLNKKIIPIVQGNDNNYYLDHDINNNSDYRGSTYLDYRNDIEKSRKLIIYGHSDNYNEVPFTELFKYKNYEYYKNHKYIYLYTKEKDYEMKVFSTYLEKDNYDYLNLDNFNGKTYIEHIESLKNKSEYNTNVKINQSKKVLVLQTCENDKYRLVMAIEQ